MTTRSYWKRIPKSCSRLYPPRLIDHEPLPWARWGEEFATAMPEEILRLQEHAAIADGAPRQDAIRGRVTPLVGLYRISRRSSVSGHHPEQ